MCTNQGCKTLVPAGGVLAGYFAYLFASVTEELNIRGRGSTFLELSSEELGRFVVPFPPAPEQSAIAEFLDRETAKIDALVIEQERLIGMLREKRQAAISHAVTKGLNPDALMRDSGVEWIGEVPAHWRTLAARSISTVVRGASPRPAGDPRYFDGSTIPWVTVGEITKDDRIHLLETSTMLTAEGAALSREFPTGTLIYSNSGATLGVPKILGVSACANDGVVAFLDLSPNVVAEYAYHFLSTITENMRERVKQGSGQPNLNTDIVKGIVLPIPPLNEQREIVGHVASIVSDFTALSESTAQAIMLLHERRAALITAAVTGQIDVRDLAPSDAA